MWFIVIECSQSADWSGLWYLIQRVKALLANPIESIELGNPSSCAEVNLCLFVPALEIVCRGTEGSYNKFFVGTKF